MQNNDKKTKQIAEEAGNSRLLKGLRTYKKDLELANTKNKPPSKNKKSVSLPKPTEDKVKIKLTKTPPRAPSTLAEEVSEAEYIRKENKIKEEEEKKLKEEIRKKQEEVEKERIRAEIEKEKARKKAIIEKELQKKEAIRKRGEEKIRLEGQIEELTTRESILLNEKAPLLIEKIELEKTLAPIIEREKVIEKVIGDTEKEESTATDANTRRAIEQKRWGVEEERRNIEKEKWDVEKSIEEILSSIEAKDVSLQTIIEQKKVADDRIEEINKEQEKEKLAQKLKEISKIKEKFELEWISLSDKKESIKESIKTVIAEEGGIESNKKALDEKERTVASTQERREIEQKRWGVEEERKKTEEKRWVLEKELDEVNQNIETLKPKYQTALAQEEEVQKKLA